MNLTTKIKWHWSIFVPKCVSVYPWSWTSDSGEQGGQIDCDHGRFVSMINHTLLLISVLFSLKMNRIFQTIIRFITRHSLSILSCFWLLRFNPVFYAARQRGRSSGKKKVFSQTMLDKIRQWDHCGVFLNRTCGRSVDFVFLC